VILSRSEGSLVNENVIGSQRCFVAALLGMTGSSRPRDALHNQSDQPQRRGESLRVLPWAAQLEEVARWVLQIYGAGDGTGGGVLDRPLEGHPVAPEHLDKLVHLLRRDVQRKPRCPPYLLRRRLLHVLRIEKE